MTNDEQIIEAETVEGEDSIEPVESQTASDSPMSENEQRLANILKLEEMIKRYVVSMENAQVEIKKHSEMLEDIFTNDPTYQQHMEQAKEATKIKSATKSQLMKRTDVSNLSEKIKEMKTQIREMKDALSDYLTQYKELSGANEIETDDGHVREIISSVKLVKKSLRQFNK